MQRNNADLAALSKAQESYENKKISYDEWNEIRQKFRNSVLYETAYEEIGLELVRLQKLARETNKISVCGILLGIGSKCKTTAQAAAIGTVLFLLPSGVEYLFSLRFFPLSILDAVQNLWEEPIIMLVESGILIALGIVGYIAAIYGHKIQKE